jgi:hypothetical protein
MNVKMDVNIVDIMNHIDVKYYRNSLIKIDIFIIYIIINIVYLFSIIKIYNEISINLC